MVKEFVNKELNIYPYHATPKHVYTLPNRAEYARVAEAPFVDGSGNQYTEVSNDVNLYTSQDVLNFMRATRYNEETGGELSLVQIYKKVSGGELA
jgi:hypothetical protein